MQHALFAEILAASFMIGCPTGVLFTLFTWPLTYKSWALGGGLLVGLAAAFVAIKLYVVPLFFKNNPEAKDLLK